MNLSLGGASSQLGERKLAVTKVYGVERKTRGLVLVQSGITIMRFNLFSSVEKHTVDHHQHPYLQHTSCALAEAKHIAKTASKDCPIIIFILFKYNCWPLLARIMAKVTTLMVMCLEGL